MKLYRLVSIIICILMITSYTAAYADTIQKDGFSTGDNSEVRTYSPNQVEGQTWLASSFYQAASMEVFIRRVGNPGDIVLNIRTMTGTEPADIVADVRLTAGSIPQTNSWVRFSFPVININQGLTYWWGVYTASGDAVGNYYAIRTNIVNGFGSGSMLNSSNGGKTWSSISDSDCLFRIYSNELAASKTPLPIPTTVATPTILPTTAIIPVVTTSPTPPTPTITPTLTTIVTTSESVETITSTVTMTVNEKNSGTTESSTANGLSMIWLLLTGAGGVIIGLATCRTITKIKSGTSKPQSAESKEQPSIPDEAKQEEKKEEEEEKKKHKKLIIYKQIDIYTHGKNRGSGQSGR